MERTFLWGWERGVYLALLLAKEMVGADVPLDILETLRPSDVTEDIIETALAQVFITNKTGKIIPAPLAELLVSSRLRDKIRIFFQRVFLPRAVIASHYSVPMDSIRILGCYPRRFWDVLCRHGQTLKKFQENDASLKAYVERTHRIANWLSGVANCNNKGTNQTYLK